MSTLSILYNYNILTVLIKQFYLFQNNIIKKMNDALTADEGGANFVYFT